MIEREATPKRPRLSWAPGNFGPGYPNTATEIAAEASGTYDHEQAVKKQTELAIAESLEIIETLTRYIDELRTKRTGGNDE